MGKERLLITGGNPLEGEVRVSGGKNTSVAVIPAVLLSDEVCTIENIPDIEDVHVLADILRSLGAKVDYVPGVHMVIIISSAPCWAAVEKRKSLIRAVVISVPDRSIST